MHLSRVDYGNPVVRIDYQLPLLYFSPPTNADSGGRSDVNGYIETMIVTSIETVKVRIRLLESEWVAHRAFLNHARANPGVPFDFWFHREDAATMYTCRLRAPQVPDPIDPSQEGVFLISEITLQPHLAATKFNVNFYGI